MSIDVADEFRKLARENRKGRNRFADDHRIKYLRELANQASGYLGEAFEAALEASMEGRRRSGISVSTETAADYMADQLRSIGFKHVETWSQGWTVGDMDGVDYGVSFGW